MIDKNEITELKKTFDDYRHVDENGNEYWNSRELSKAMGYNDYRNFKQAINRAKNQLTTIGKDPDGHFVESTDMVKTGKGAIREVDSYKLTRGTAYLVAMNADPAKPEVAFAQQYFLQNTAKIEKIEQRMKEKEIIDRRDMLRTANKHLARTLLQHDVEAKDIGIVMDAGDKGFFDMPTKDTKEYLSIPQNKPIADVLGADMCAYKAVAQINTRREIIKQDASGTKAASVISFDENRNIRNMIEDKFDDYPENLATGEDAAKIQRKYDKETDKLLSSLDIDLSAFI